MAGRINSIYPYSGDRSASTGQFGGIPVGNTGRSPASKKNMRSVNASGLAEALDPVGTRLGKARQQAMKFIRDALAGDLSIDEDMKARNARIGDLSRTINKSQKAVKNIDNEISDLREKYGVDPDSQEEKELRTLVDDEELPSGLTEYQERALPLLREKKVHQDKLKEAETGVRIENMTMRDMTVERLKTDPAGDAWDQADSIMEAAGKEVAGMVIGDAMAHIDEQIEEKREEAEKAKEEKEKLEERIEAAKEKKEEREELTEEILEAADRMSVKELDTSNPDSEINKLMNKLKLIETDVKGAVVDEQV